MPYRTFALGIVRRDRQSRGLLLHGLIPTVAVSLSLGLGLHTAPAPAPAPARAPILIVADPADHFGAYYAEILRAEGLNEVEIGQDLSPAALAGRQAVLLADRSLSGADVSTLASWVAAGGDLVAMRPPPELAALLGLGTLSGTLADAYMKVDTASAPGAGITADTLQFHGVADRWSLAGAAPVATLYGDAGTATTDPAVTLRSVGAAGGSASAFTYDLARSVVYTRQGNPAWVGQERDNDRDNVIRSDDLFFGAKPGDVQPDWVDMSKVAIPQADEQQRLLANLLTQQASDRLPLPRFWYLPRGLKAAVVMTGDDHGAPGGTPARFAQLDAASAPGCSVADWTCLRMTSYAYPGTPTTDAQAATYQALGFELALHLSTGCHNFTPDSLEGNWVTQLPQFAASWPSVVSPVTSRTHCIAWSTWAGEPKAELAHGVRLDMNYYYWPAAWVQDRPGMFTGSGFPMRFADVDGTPIDVYQATTQITDESGMTIPTHIAALLDGALGPNGYYGAFTVNMHTDMANHPGANAIVAAATERGVPVIASYQLLQWLDRRNAATFDGVAYAGGKLTFSIGAPNGAAGLQAMLPVNGPSGPLLGVTRGGADVPTEARTVKGVDYAVLDAQAGDYVATYEAPVEPTPTPTPTATATPTETPTETPTPEAAAPPVVAASPPGPTPAPPTPTPTPLSATAAKVTLAKALSRGLRVTVKAPKAGLVSVSASSGGKTIGSGTATAKAAGTVSITVRFKHAAKLRHARRLSLRLTIAQGAAKRTVSVTLTR